LHEVVDNFARANNNRRFSYFALARSALGLSARRASLRFTFYFHIIIIIISTAATRHAARGVGC
jgi:hypothetical protein